MRKRYRVALLAAIVAALVVPLGFALSIESPARPPYAGQAIIADAAASDQGARSPLVDIARSHAAPAGEWSTLQPVPDAAKLLLVGTLLFGLAAFVRKAM